MVQSAVPGTYHTHSSCTLQHSLLNCPRTKKMLLSSIREVQDHLQFELIAYVICSTEFHMIIRTFDGGSPLHLVMKGIKYKFSRKYNAAFKNKGTTWSRRYDKKRIENSADPAGYFKWLVAELAAVQNTEHWMTEAKENSFSSINTFFVQGFRPELKIAEHRTFLAAGKNTRERIREFRRFAGIYRETKFLDP